MNRVCNTNSFPCLFADDIIKQTGNNNVVVKQLDVSDFDSVRKFAAEINEEEPHIHVLVFISQSFI